jgi:ubiquinone/menaquinone biosynthesis C-methylase UbiE
MMSGSDRPFREGVDAMRRTLPLCRLPIVLWALVPVLALAQQGAPEKPPSDPPKAKTKSAAKAKPARRPHRDSDKTYMGRPIAEVMSYLGADWLVRETREQEEQPDRMLEALGDLEGATVADVGAGVGYTTLRLARRVGPRGTVLATDLQPEMIRMLKENIRQAELQNVKPILCTQDDPKLPEGKVDLILLVDVYHECAQPEAALEGWRKALKPGGRLVLVEFRAEDPDVPIKPEHKMTLSQVRKEIEPQGFTFKESLEFLPWQHIIVFEKPARGSKPVRADGTTKAADQ